eukprot:Ihof_evm4s173 gene=Ihof_evmTU4s173
MAMPRCVECGSPVKDLYKEYSNNNIRLTHCTNCGKVADKYIEYEYLIIVIDMLLHKPEVYRHLLFNCLPSTHSNIKYRIIKLGFVCILCDAYLKCTRVYINEEIQLFLSEVWTLFLKAWLAAAIGFLIYILGVCCLVHLFEKRLTYSSIQSHIAIPLMLSGFVRLLVVLMWIWDYHDRAFAWVIYALNISSNAEALH